MMQAQGTLTFNYPPQKQNQNKQAEDARQEGAKDFLKDYAKKQKENAQKLKDTVNHSTTVLFKLKTAFWFDLFPDEVIIDLNKVDIIYNEFFGSHNIHSILVKDISDVEVQTSPFFSTLKIVDKGYKDTTVDVRYLKTAEAVKARRIIQGLMVIRDREIDLDQFKEQNILQIIEQLGKARRWIDSYPFNSFFLLGSYF